MDHRVRSFSLVLDGLANLRDLIGAEADLLGLAAGITNVEDPKGVTVATSAFRIAGRVMDDALEKRAAEDVGNSLISCSARARSWTRGGDRTRRADGVKKQAAVLARKDLDEAVPRSTW
jgi:hypothetical protein